MTDEYGDFSYVNSVHTLPRLKGTPGVKMALQAFGRCGEIWGYEYEKDKRSRPRVF